MKKWLTEIFLLGIVIIVCSYFFSSIVIEGFGSPMFGLGDNNIWSTQAHYFKSNISWGALPSLSFENDDFIYPYGGNHVFQPWSLEMCYFWSLCQHFLGHGPWLQIYYLITVIVTCLGSFILLRTVYGFKAALIASIILAFANYFAFGQFPGHFGVACSHWLILNFVAQFIFLRKVFEEKKIPGKWLLINAFLSIAALGSDLSYMCGAVLTGVVFTGFTVFVYSLYLATVRVCSLVKFIEPKQFLENKNNLIVTCCGVCIPLYLYLPLLLEIYWAVGMFDVAELPDGIYWVNPLRLLMPILPNFIDPNLMNCCFGDSGESLFQLTPGLSITIAGIVGLGASFYSKQFYWKLPFLVFIILILAFHAEHIDILRVFPWSKTFRINSRLTSLYFVLSILFFLDFYRHFGHQRFFKFVFIMLGTLFVIEAVHAYKFFKNNTAGLANLSSEFYEFTEVIRQSPGEAVLEWPFCVAGGNGVGAPEFGIYYRIQSASSGMQQFDQKKRMGMYYGRLASEQLETLHQRGWKHLFFAGTKDIWAAEQQQRDFNANEWEFMESFYRFNDFCGILLYEQLLPRETILGFYERFGEPSRKIDSIFGPLAFISKNEIWKQGLNREMGESVTLSAYTVLFDVPYDLNTLETVKLLSEGWGAPEDFGVWSCHDIATLVFKIENRSEAEAIKVSLDMFAFLAEQHPEQRIDIMLNGVLEKSLIFSLEKNDRIEELIIPASKLPTQGEATLNIEFQIHTAKAPSELGLSSDTRRLGIALKSLKVEAINDGEF